MEERREEGNIHYNPEQKGRFRVINRIEIPKGEYTYDKAVQAVIQLDDVYNPEYIYPDRGAGEYQIERLRQALGSKVKGVHLGSSHEVIDPVTKEMDRKPIKPFMVNQTTLLLERGMLRIPSPKIDETIFRQMTNYQVVRIAPKTGEPTYSDEDEHALDAMMLALLAFIIEMPEISAILHKVVVARNMASAKINFRDPLAEINQSSSYSGEGRGSRSSEWDEPGSPPLKKVSVGWKKKESGSFSWGSRGSGRNAMPRRRGW